MTGGYFIDATEVTRDQYAAVLPSLSTAGQPPVCGWNTGFVPENENAGAGCGSDVWPPGSNGDAPVVCVNWCGAYAYCQAVGKRLCGKIGGGTNDILDYADETKSEWFNACTSGAQNDFPYSGEYNGLACNGSDNGVDSVVDVGSEDACHSSVLGYQGVYDLSGNVSEWEDSCSDTTGSQDECRVRGGSFDGDMYYLRCDSDYSYPRDYQVGAFGIRCCGP